MIWNSLVQWLVSVRKVYRSTVGSQSSKSLRSLKSFKLLFISLKYGCNFCCWYVIVWKFWKVLLILGKTYFISLMKEQLLELQSFLFLFDLGLLIDTTTSSSTSVEVELLVESRAKVSLSLWSVWIAWEICCGKVWVTWVVWRVFLSCSGVKCWSVSLNGVIICWNDSCLCALFISGHHHNSGNKRRSWSSWSRWDVVISHLKEIPGKFSLYLKWLQILDYNKHLRVFIEIFA